jgi:hypothetical protein
MSEVACLTASRRQGRIQFEVQQLLFFAPRLVSPRPLQKIKINNFEQSLSFQQFRMLSIYLNNKLAKKGISPGKPTTGIIGRVILVK